MPPALFVLYLHLLGRPPMHTLALGLVRLAHLLTAGAHPPALLAAVVKLRSSAIWFAGHYGATTADLADAMPMDLTTLPMVPPGLAVTALTNLLELAQDHPDRIRISTPLERWKALLADAATLAERVEQLEADPGHRTTDPAPAPIASGEVPLG